jgi:cytochrome c biogenesis protein CcdA
MIQIFTSLLLGLLMILDPCTLFTSIAAIGYIDKEITNRQKVLLNGLMFVFGKLATYTLLAIPFIMGAKTDGIKHFLQDWGEPLLAAFMLVCGILLLFIGQHHHEHDHGATKWMQSIDSQSSWLWSFMLGIFFAIAFCPHRLVYFFTMIDIAINIPAIWNWMLPVVFGLGTGLPIMVIAWLISYSAVSISTLTKRLHSIEKWIRYISAVLFIGYGIYLCVHIFAHEDGCSCNHHHSTCVTSRH